MNSLLATLILLAGATGASSGSSAPRYGSPVLVVGNTGGVSTPRPAQNGVSIVSEDVLLGRLSLPEQGRDSVLVVPTPGLPVESLAELTEDMTIMCRIFDKSVPSSRTSVGFAYGGRSDVFQYTFGQPAAGAQGLYLDGYGALFFLHVDDPLLPIEPTDPAQAKPAAPVDSVWSQTIQEMTGQQDDTEPGSRSAPAYDAQKVENLKKTLIRTLAHASNIRARRPQDVITVVVGPLDDSRAYGYARALETRLGSMYSSGSGADAGHTRGRRSARGAPVPAPVMIMRAGKADIDAFARGQLTAAQFTEKVEILWSRPGGNERKEPQGQPPAAPTPGTPR